MTPADSNCSTDLRLQVFCFSTALPCSDTIAAPLTLTAMVGIGVCNFFGLNVILTMIKHLGAAQVTGDDVGETGSRVSPLADGC